MISRAIEARGWRIAFYFAYYQPRPERILEALTQAGAPREIKDRAAEIIEGSSLNCGFTYTNKRDRAAVTYIGRTTNAAQFLNTYAHELRHLADAATESTDGEPPAYFTGEICEQLKDIICKFSCEKCRKNL